MANNYGYKLTDFTPSDEYKRLQEKKNQSDEAYQMALERLKGGTSYTDAYKNAINKYTNRPEFSYDINGDALYQQYKNQYQALGKQAAGTAAAQSADLTGGYGNSYGTTASNQAYQQYLSQLNNMVPTLYEKAYNRYNDEGNALLNQINVLGNADQMEYSRNHDLTSLALDQLKMYSDMQSNRYNQDLDLWSQTNSMGMDNHFKGKQLEMDEDHFQKNLKWEQDKYDKDIYMRAMEAAAKQKENKITAVDLTNIEKYIKTYLLDKNGKVRNTEAFGQLLDEYGIFNTDLGNAIWDKYIPTSTQTSSSPMPQQTNSSQTPKQSNDSQIPKKKYAVNYPRNNLVFN